MPNVELRHGVTLARIICSAERLHEIRKSDVRAGDWLFVKTLQSLYRIHVLEEGLFEVYGGWFEKKGIPSARLRISGCTWGGSAIKVDIVAACGLRLEFGNRLITSPIQKIFVLTSALVN